MRAGCAYCPRKLFPGYLHCKHGLLLLLASICFVYRRWGVVIAAEWHRGVQQKPVSAKSGLMLVSLRAGGAYCPIKLLSGEQHNTHGQVLQQASIFLVYWRCGVVITAECHRAVQQKPVSAKSGLGVVFLRAGGAYCPRKLFPKCLHNKRAQVLQLASVFSVYWWCGVVITAEWHRAVQQKSVSRDDGSTVPETVPRWL